MKKSALVVGGGLAGIAAATALSIENIDVTLIERRKVLGGRASAFPIENGWLDNCQHVALGSCVHLLDLLVKLGTRNLVTFHADIPFLEPSRVTVLGPSPIPAPFHFIPRFLGAKLFTFRQKLNILKLFSRLRHLDRNDPAFDEITLYEWLLGQGQSEQIMENFWNLIFVSSLNELPNRTSAKYGIMVLQESFLSGREGASVGIPNVSLSELYHQAAKTLFLERNVRVIHENVQAFILGNGKPKVSLDNGSVLEGDDLISAVPFYNLKALLPETLQDEPIVAQTQHLSTSPILGIHLWFDRPITRYPFGALSGSPIHWFFSKPSTGESHYVQLVISACRPFMETSTEELINLGMQELKTFLPQSASARLLEGKVVREARATFSPAPGCDQYRPPQETSIPHLTLAGDWTRTDWPATMEGAVISGYRAAERVLKGSALRVTKNNRR